MTCRNQQNAEKVPLNQPHAEDLKKPSSICFYKLGSPEPTCINSDYPDGNTYDLQPHGERQRIGTHALRDAGDRSQARCSMHPYEIVVPRVMQTLAHNPKEATAP